MLSNLSYTTSPINLPVLPDTTTLLEDDLLNFDDLLDIAREYEFTRTITHLWSCEDDHSTLSETGLDDLMLATVSSPPKPQESPLSPFTESLSIHFEPPVHVQEMHLHRPASVPASPVLCATNPSTTMYPVHLSENDDQIQPESSTPTTSILQGWSPPDGSQFLDLDDDSLIPPQSRSQSSRDLWIPPWLATFLPTTSQPECNANANQSLPTASETGDAQPQMKTAAVAQLKPPLESSANATRNDPKKENIAPSPVQPSRRATQEPARSRSALRPLGHQGSTPHTAKQPRSRPPFAVGASSSATHARPPRGGIPPHIARSVTKANILRAEQESQVIRDACSNTTTGDGKKPSVLRGSTAVERENGKTGNDCGSGSMKKLSDPCENSGRATKRARV